MAKRRRKGPLRAGVFLDHLPVTSRRLRETPQRELRLADPVQVTVRPRPGVRQPGRQPGGNGLVLAKLEPGLSLQQHRLSTLRRAGMRLAKGLQPFDRRGEHAVAEVSLGHVERQLGPGLGLRVVRLAKRRRHGQRQRE